MRLMDRATNPAWQHREPPARLVVLLITGCLSFILASPASAIVGGQPDGDQHPSVGLVTGYDETGLYYGCSGTLISQTVFLTAAHCLPGVEVGQPDEIRVSFDPTPELIPGEPQGWSIPIPDVQTFVSGTPHNNPTFDGAAPFDPLYASNDFGVIVLSRPANEVFPGLVPATLAEQGHLNGLQGKDKTGFQVVGFGTQNQIRPRRDTQFLDWTRRAGNARFKKLYPPSAFEVRGSPSSAPVSGNGGSCFGDSGGAVFHGSLLTGVMSGSNCFGNTYAARLDTVAVRAFIGQFVTLP